MQPLPLIDTHCHLDYEPLSGLAEHYLEQGLAQGIVQTLVPATTMARFAHITSFVAHYPRLQLALGLHPIYLDEHTDDVLDEAAAFIALHEPVAIGEVGLDYFVETLDRDRQQIVFERMIDLATHHHKPLVLHVRRSHDAVIATLKKRKFAFGGIVHAFAGSFEQANEFIKLGFALGFGGVMTYTSATRVRRLARDLPLQSIVLETDAPDMKPADWPEEHNSPLALLRNFSVFCQLRSEPADVLAHTTTATAKQRLGLAS